MTVSHPAIGVVDLLFWSEFQNRAKGATPLLSGMPIKCSCTLPKIRVSVLDHKTQTDSAKKHFHFVGMFSTVSSYLAVDVSLDSSKKGGSRLKV